MSSVLPVPIISVTVVFANREEALALEQSDRLPHNMHCVFAEQIIANFCEGLIDPLGGIVLFFPLVPVLKVTNQFRRAAANSCGGIRRKPV
jgi:hypothetical protein